VKLIGLMMTAHDEDVAEDVLARSMAKPDELYVLDGSDTRAALPEWTRYWRDTDVPWSGPPRDGWRQWLYDRAVADHGTDHWFLVLHSDEVWTFDPRGLPFKYPEADGFAFRLPCWFPRSGTPWQIGVPALAQIHWSLGPGWPEFRMFRGGEGVRFDPSQHFDVRPTGLSSVVQTELTIEHYPYRSPASQRRRARHHDDTGFDPDNYRHVSDGSELFWTDERIASWMQKPCWGELRFDGSPAAP